MAAELSNLSVGGMALTGAPADWVVGNTVRFELRNESEILPVEGRVAWSQEGAIGVAFVTMAAGHERMVYRMLRRLAEEK